MRGSVPTCATIGRTVLVSRPSMRMPRVEHGKAHDFGFEIVEQVLELVLGELAFVIADEFGGCARADFRDLVAADELLRDLEGGLQIRCRRRP